MELFFNLLPVLLVVLMLIVVLVVYKLIRKRIDIIQNKEEDLNSIDETIDKTKQKMSNRDVVGGMIFILFGIIMFFFDIGHVSRSLQFGADFYTEIHQEIVWLEYNIVRLAEIVKFGFGFLLVGLGVDRITRK
jgi:NADH:ubiquinone oxidoreductase subunit 3 (subunit A)